MEFNSLISAQKFPPLFCEIMSIKCNIQEDMTLQQIRFRLSNFERILSFISFQLK